MARGAEAVRASSGPARLKMVFYDERWGSPYPGLGWLVRGRHRPIVGVLGASWDYDRTPFCTMPPPLAARRVCLPCAPSLKAAPHQADERVGSSQVEGTASRDGCLNTGVKEWSKITTAAARPRWTSQRSTNLTQFHVLDMLT